MSDVRDEVLRVRHDSADEFMVEEADAFKITLDLRGESARQGASLYAACIMIKEEDDARSRAIFELIDRARAKFPDWILNEELEKAREAEAAGDPVVKKLLDEELEEGVEAPLARLVGGATDE